VRGGEWLGEVVERALPQRLDARLDARISPSSRSRLCRDWSPRRPAAARAHRSGTCRDPPGTTSKAAASASRSASWPRLHTVTSYPSCRRTAAQLSRQGVPRRPPRDPHSGLRFPARSPQSSRLAAFLGWTPSCVIGSDIALVLGNGRPPLRTVRATFVAVLQRRPFLRHVQRSMGRCTWRADAVSWPSRARASVNRSNHCAEKTGDAARPRQVPRTVRRGGRPLPRTSAMSLPMTQDGVHPNEGREPAALLAIGPKRRPACGFSWWTTSTPWRESCAAGARQRRVRRYGLQPRPGCTRLAEAAGLRRRAGDPTCPKIDGLALLRAALGTNHDTIVIVMTGNPSRRVERRGAAAGRVSTTSPSHSPPRTCRS